MRCLMPAEACQVPAGRAGMSPAAQATAAEMQSQPCCKVTACGYSIVCTMPVTVSSAH